MQLSVIIITKNEQQNIVQCLESVSWADEIVIVDNNSDDNTIELASQFTDNILITKDWPGFGVQKNRALERARGKWVLSIDADERVTPALQQEIMQLMQNDQKDAYYIPRVANFCGQWIRHGGWYPDYVLRLFKRNKATFSKLLVHERVELIDGATTAYLKHDLLHYSFDNLEQVLSKINQYSTANAKIMQQNNRSSGLFKAISHGLAAFIRNYILRAGFLDGKVGFILAIYQAECSYYRYLKAMYLPPK